MSASGKTLVAKRVSPGWVRCGRNLMGRTLMGRVPFWDEGRLMKLTA